MEQKNKIIQDNEIDHNNSHRGFGDGRIVCIPRIQMITNENSFEFKRVQLPISPSPTKSKSN